MNCSVIGSGSQQILMGAAAVGGSRYKTDVPVVTLLPHSHINPYPVFRTRPQSYVNHPSIDPSSAQHQRLLTFPVLQTHTRIMSGPYDQYNQGYQQYPPQG